MFSTKQTASTYTASRAPRLHFLFVGFITAFELRVSILHRRLELRVCTFYLADLLQRLNSAFRYSIGVRVSSSASPTRLRGMGRSRQASRARAAARARADAAAAGPSLSAKPELARPSPELACPSPELACPSPELARPRPELARPSPELASPSPELARPSPELARTRDRANVRRTPAAVPAGTGIRRPGGTATAPTDIRATPRAPGHAAPPPRVLPRRCLTAPAPAALSGYLD